MLGAEWGTWWGEMSHGAALEHAGLQVVSVVSVYSLVLISIVVATVHFLCHSVRLPLPNPRVLLFSSHSSPHPS